MDETLTRDRGAVLELGARRETVAANEAARVEDRPTGDFIDGYLAGLATASAALVGAPRTSYFYSFDWIGDRAEPREAALAAAFQSAPDALRLEIRPLAGDGWRQSVAEICARWFGQGLGERSGAAMAEEMVEILDAYLSTAPFEVFDVRPSAVPGAAPLEAKLGRAHEHVLFETIEGRLLLEFSRDV